MNSAKGFTLLEVLISVAIMLGGMLTLALISSGNNMRIRKTALNNNVAVLLERKMTELEALYRDKNLDEIPEEDSGDFGSDFKQYRWAMKSQKFEMPDISSVLISRDEGANDMLLTVIKQTQEFISKSMKEVTLSVFVKTPTREVEYSISTYFVTYDEELNFGGGGQ
ncbi:MAG: type II secretion system protein [Bdellovibrionaceae bacterium]|nr:type II secretion system protein [Pseudobdellovibrionaceae bacterium]